MVYLYRMNKLPGIGLVIKMSAFTAWAATTIFVISAAFFVLSNPQSFEQINSSFFNLDPSHSYSLFTAVPEEGQVLGQQINMADGRAAILREFLQTYRSPLSDHAEKFIEVADKYQLPWTLLPAICGKESGFGKVVPLGSYNCFGWAVYTNQSTGTTFANWEDAIEKVGKGLKRDYFDKGLTTLEQIERYYTPISANRDNSWRGDVAYFQQELENWGKINKDK